MNIKTLSFLVSILIIITSCNSFNNKEVSVETNIISISKKTTEDGGAALRKTKFLFGKDYVIITCEFIGIYNRRFTITKADELFAKKINNAFLIDGFPIESKSFIFSFHFSEDGLFDIKFFEDNALNILTNNFGSYTHFSIFEDPALAKQKFYEIKSLYNL